MWHGTEHFWNMGLSWIIGLIFFIVIIWLIVKIVNQSKTQNSYEKKSALDILNERYVRGEISKEEYKEKKSDIQ